MTSRAGGAVNGAGGKSVGEKSATYKVQAAVNSVQLGRGVRLTEDSQWQPTPKLPLPDAAAGSVEMVRPTYGWLGSGVKVYRSVKV